MDNKTIEKLEKWEKDFRAANPNLTNGYNAADILEWLASLLPANLNEQELRKKFKYEFHFDHSATYDRIFDWFTPYLSKDADDKNCESCKGKGSEVSYEGDEIITPREVACSDCGGTGLKNTNLKNNELKKALSQCDYPNCLKDADEVKELRAEIDWYDKKVSLIEKDDEERMEVYLAYGEDKKGNKYEGSAYFFADEFESVRDIERKGVEYWKTSFEQVSELLKGYKGALDNSKKETETWMGEYRKLENENEYLTDNNNKFHERINHDREIKDLLRAEISELKSKHSLQPVNEWVSVETGLPKEMDEVIFFNTKVNESYNITPSSGYYKNGVFKSWSGNTLPVTHWMPLPNPPKTN